MIQSLKIQNFQSHKESSLEFVPGLNVIVGSTDSGKTSIIRALRWLVWNRPGGEAFRSDWGGCTRVDLSLDNKMISRIKGKSDHPGGDNLYEIVGTDRQINQGEYFKAFGSGVPEPIQEILNITEVNLQMQLESHFLLSKSPGEVAAYFNRIAHLEKIDTATRYIMSGLRDLERSQKRDKEEIETLEEELTTYDYLDKVEAELEVLEDLEKDWETKTKTLNRLEHTVNQIEGTDTDIKQHDRILSFKEPVEKILRLQQTKEEKWQVLDDLQETRAEISRIDTELEYHQKTLIAIPNHVDLLLDLHGKRKKKQEEEETLSKLFLEINSLELQIVDVKEDLESAEAEFHENMPEQCPLCGK